MRIFRRKARQEIWRLAIGISKQHRIFTRPEINPHRAYAPFVYILIRTFYVKDAP